MTQAVVVRPVRPADREAWAALFAAYREFYELEDEPEVVDRVWDWIQDPEHETNALVAVVDGEVVGFAHHRHYARPSEGSCGLFLDDLYTLAGARGQGIGRSLINALVELARERGCAKVRWVTAPDNTTAQRLYDDVAERTDWLTYDLLV
ncbi:MAG: family N-acetyltransferase [Marmoricola sp.]|nr:family N-acetyltransferase [Marmoricola sp.]